MSCQGCGKAFDSPNAAFCTGCGRKTQSAPPPQPMQQFPPQPQPYIPPPTHMQPPKPPSAMNAIAPWIIRGGVGVLVLMFFIAPTITMLGISGATLLQITEAAFRLLNWGLEDAVFALIYVGVHVIMMILVLSLATIPVAAGVFAVIGGLWMVLFIVVSEGFASPFVWVKAAVFFVMAIISFAFVRKRRL